MTRNRSREAETEDVNQRRLRRGAVKRQHLTRWAVGATELAPGIVGDIHLHPTTLEIIREIGSGAGVGQLLVRSATDQSFADGGDYVTPDSTIYQHGFDMVASAANTVIWPIDAVGEIQVEFVWDTYEGGGTIEIEVDGTVPAWGLIATGDTGQRGCKRRSVHISEGSAVRIKITQDSGSAQTGSAHVEYSIPDPSVDAIVPPPPPGPLELGPRVWYRAESMALADGDPLSQWDDISGNDFHLEQSTLANRPLFRAADLNGRATVEFDGTNDGMIYNSLPVTLQTDPASGWTVFAVFNTDNAAATQIVLNGDDQLGGSRASQFLYVESADLKSSIRSAVVVTSGETVVSSTWHLGEVVRTATDAEVLLDAVGNAPTSDAGMHEAERGFYMGWHPAAPAFFNGRIAEVIGWDRALTSAERLIMRDYFNTEYGV